MAALVNLAKAAFGRQEKHARCLLLGIDSAGKTSFLYKRLLGEIVTTIPTIGFNVETIKISGSNEITFWDVGGCDKIRPLVRHYFSDDMAMLFVLDIHDERLDYALEELSFQVIAAATVVDISFVGIMLNKQDKPGSTPELRKKCSLAAEETMRKTGFRINWRIFDSEGLSGTTGTGVDEVLQGIWEGIKNHSPGKPKSSQADASQTYPDPSAPPSREDIQDRIAEINRTRRVVYRYPDTFFKKMDTGTLDTWDHADHLYAAAAILYDLLPDASNTMSPQGPVIAAVDIFLGHLNKMLQAAPGKYRNTAHRTLTTFWINEVYHAMYKVKETGSTYWPEKFFVLLDQNPRLMDGGLWKQYYSKSYLFTPKAKDNYVTPDKELLPSFSPVPPKIPQGFDGTKLREDLTSRRLKRWAYATLQTVKATGARRGLVVKNALSELQTKTIRQRIQDPSLEPYSETQAYFWIQIVHAGMEKILLRNPNLSFPAVSFDTIEALWPVAFGYDDLWKEYYHDDDWKSVKARVGFIPSTKRKIIPNFAPVLTQGADWKSLVSEVRIPTIDELTQRAAWISEYRVEQTEDAKDPKPTPPEPTSSEPAPVEPSARDITFHEYDDDDDWVDLRETTTKVAEVKISKAEPPPAPSIPDINKNSETNSTAPESTCPESWREHAKLLHKLFDALPKVRSKINRGNISQIAYIQLNSRRSQITKVTFWINMVVAAYIDTYGLPTAGVDGDARLDSPEEDEQISATLHEFLLKNLDICWEDLWMVYYTELTWGSVTANEVILGADRKQMRSVRGKEQLTAGTSRRQL